MQAASAAAAGKNVVMIHLNGGNDALNTVTPIDDGTGTLRTDYELNRVGLRLPTAGLLPIGSDANTGAQLGLNPALEGVKNLYDAGKCAIVQGCGYPHARLSHDASNRVWRTGYPVLLAPSANGWVGNTLIELGYLGTDIPAVNIGANVAPSFQQAVTNVLAFESLDDFGFPYDRDHPGDAAAKRACFAAQAAEAQASGQPQEAYAGATGGSALAATEAFVKSYVNDRGAWGTLYDILGTAPAHDLREVAKVMYGVSLGVPGMDARYFQVSVNGFDTHSNQGGGDAGGRHYELLKGFSDAIELFYADLGDMGVADDTVILVWSEFGRRVKQNGNGTDHGSLGPVMLLGGNVIGGLYGNHPDISPAGLDAHGNMAYSQNPANPYRPTDFRDVFGTVLEQWLCIPEATILSQLFPPETLAYDPNDYWVDGNHDFDLGFLPPAPP
ncbi:MAG: DUF1501 domain-containing protein [Candidatus Binatia bacterium]|nr:DUF1501 domain-containing protein [Candidatus Binatia bacterium]